MVKGYSIQSFHNGWTDPIFAIHKGWNRPKNEDFGVSVEQDISKIQFPEMGCKQQILDGWVSWRWWSCSSSPLSHPAPLPIGSAQENLVCKCECRFAGGMDDDAIKKPILWNEETVLPWWETNSQYPDGREYYCCRNLLLKVDEQDWGWWRIFFHHTIQSNPDKGCCLTICPDVSAVLRVQQMLTASASSHIT